MCSYCIIQLQQWWFLHENYVVVYLHYIAIHPSPKLPFLAWDTLHLDLLHPGVIHRLTLLCMYFHLGIFLPACVWPYPRCGSDWLPYMHSFVTNIYIMSMKGGTNVTNNRKYPEKPAETMVTSVKHVMTAQLRQLSSTNQESWSFKIQ